MDKRTFLKSILLGGVGIFAGSLSIVKAGGLKQHRIGMFSLPLLRYGFKSIEPFMDAEVLKIHYEQIHAAYTHHLNKSVKKAGLVGKSARDLLQEVAFYNDEIARNAAGYLNHKIFWTMLGPSALKNPSPQLKAAIDRDFGSFAQFQSTFENAAQNVFGSGWVWVMSDKYGRLEVLTTVNDEFPAIRQHSVSIPVICLDLWEHAYMKSHDSRDSYLKAFWSAINWDNVSARYRTAKRRKV